MATGVGARSLPGPGFLAGAPPPWDRRLWCSLQPWRARSGLVPAGLALTREPTACPQQFQNGESEESHAQFLKALQNAVSTFVNRMKSNHVRGRSITNDSAVLSLFQSINGMHPQLLELLNQLDERRRTSLPAPPTPCPGLAAPTGAVCALGPTSPASAL